MELIANARNLVRRTHEHAPNIDLPSGRDWRRPQKKAMTPSSRPASSRLSAVCGRIQDSMVRRTRRTAALLRPCGDREAAGPCGSATSRPTLGDRFFALPVELQLQVLDHLSFFDILNLRRSCSRLRSLTVDNEHYIVRHYIRTSVPTYITKLYPPPRRTPPNIHYLTDLAYKQRISTNLAFYLAEQVVKEMMGRTRRRLPKEFKHHLLNKLRRGMAPLIFALFQFFETYRRRKLERLDLDAKGTPINIFDGLSSEKNLKLQSEILSQYPDMLLLQVHQMYHLLLHLFFRRMTPPSLSFARTFGRWTSLDRPPNEAFAKVFILGGIGEVWQLYRIRGYSRRRRALDKYVRQLDAERLQWLAQNAGLDKDVGPARRGSASSAGHERETTSGGVARKGLAADGGSVSAPSIGRLAQLDVDELMQVWTPAAEERLLSRDIVRSLDEVNCCGRFVSQLLWMDDDDEDGVEGELDEEDSDDEDDSGDEHSMSLDGGTLNGDESDSWNHDESAGPDDYDSD